MADDLAALRAAIDQFPATVTAKLRAVAWRTSRAAKERARQLAPKDASVERGKYTAGNPHLADSIVIIEDEANQTFLVRPETPWLPNLGLWLERGTAHMTARPFMRPAADAVEDTYKREMEAAAMAAANDLVKD